MRKIVTMLLATTMLAPAAAEAQEIDAGANAGISRRGELREMRRRAEADAPRERTEASAPQRAERPAPFDRGQRERPARGFDGGLRERPQPPVAGGDRPQRQDWQRFRQDRRDDGQDFARERRDDRQDFDRERREDRQRLRDGQVTPGQFRADRRDDRQDFRRDRRDDRADFRRERRDDRPGFAGDWRRDQPRDRDWNGGRSNGWADRFQGGHQVWNRGWRNDRQYDWSGWRSRNGGAFRLPRYYAPSGWGYGYRRFSVGVTLSPSLWGEDYWLDDPWSYRLPEAYGPYRWVRYYDDALLVDVRSGRVVDVVYDIFY